MRPIKFRVWDGGFFITEEENMYISSYGELLNSDMDERENWLFMQFTGLKDKNGEEIFIGDIVRVVFDGRIAEIKKGQCIIEAISGPHSYMLCNMEGNDFEIIGNIYQNPELLTK